MPEQPDLRTATGAGDYPPPARGEPHWPAQATVLLAIALQLLLPTRLAIGSKWILPGLEAVMLLTLFVASPQRLEAPHSVRRQLTLATTAVVSIANGIALALLAHYLLHHSTPNGRQLIVAGACGGRQIRLFRHVDSLRVTAGVTAATHILSRDPE